jgi:hypothetical protein
MRPEETWFPREGLSTLARPETLGGKAANLARLEALSLPVPPWYVVTTDAFERALGPVRRAYSIVYHCFAEVMGIDARTVRANREVFENMLGLFRGQVYYNLRNWYRLVRLFPGFNYNKSFMESMMGVREAAGAEDTQPAASGLQRYTVELPALLRLLGRSARNSFTSGASWTIFRNIFASVTIAGPRWISAPCRRMSSPLSTVRWRISSSGSGRRRSSTISS